MNNKSKFTILIVDDNDADIRRAQTLLEDAAVRCEVVVKKTLFDALSFVQDNPVDLVLLELNLPDSAGFKTLTSFLEKVPETPVVLLTSVNNEIIGHQAIRAGAQDYLVKSQLDSRTLGRVVRYSIQRASEKLELQRATRQLESARRWFLEVQEMAHLGTWELDIVTNKMLWTDEVYRILGFKPGSITPSMSTYLEYVHPDDLKAVESFFSNASNNTNLHHIEHRLVVDGKNIRYVSLHGKLQMEEGKIKVVGGIQDITERKLNEQLMLEKNISSRSASIQEEALAKMSFNIRTPLSSVTGLLHLLEESGLPSKVRPYFEDLKTSVGDLSVAVNNLLNFTLMVSNAMELNEEAFVLKEFIKGLSDVMHIKAAAKQVAIEFEVAPNVPESFVSDPRKLNQILYNLLDNAIRFSPEGEKVRILVSGEYRGDGTFALQFHIVDHGPGMDAKQVEKLKQAASQLSEPALEGKKQLGIAIAEKLIQVLDGKLDIESQPGKGSSFKVSVPVKVQKRMRVFPGGAPEAPLHILLVEDHPINQLTTRKVLTAWSPHVNVDIASNGQVAVDMLKEQPYDLVLMDLQMPVMDGFEATQAIRTFSKVPIIALTANASIPEQERCLQIGMNDYLTKPFKPEELYARILAVVSLVLN